MKKSVKCIIYKKIDYVCIGFDKCISIIITTQRQINNYLTIIKYKSITTQ